MNEQDPTSRLSQGMTCPFPKDRAGTTRIPVMERVKPSRATQARHLGIETHPFGYRGLWFDIGDLGVLGVSVRSTASMPASTLSHVCGNGGRHVVMYSLVLISWIRALTGDLSAELLYSARSEIVMICFHPRRKSTVDCFPIRAKRQPVLPLGISVLNAKQCFESFVRKETDSRHGHNLHVSNRETDEEAR